MCGFFLTTRVCRCCVQRWMPPVHVWWSNPSESYGDPAHDLRFLVVKHPDSQWLFSGRCWNWMPRSLPSWQIWLVAICGTKRSNTIVTSQKNLPKKTGNNNRKQMRTATIRIKRRNKIPIISEFMGCHSLYDLFCVPSSRVILTRDRAMSRATVSSRWKGQSLQPPKGRSDSTVRSQWRATLKRYRMHRHGMWYISIWFWGIL